MYVSSGDDLFLCGDIALPKTLSGFSEALMPISGHTYPVALADFYQRREGSRGAAERRVQAGGSNLGWWW
jgi:hypothetical protein